MRGRSLVATAVPLAAVVLAFAAAPALAQPEDSPTPPTTPTPTLTNPNSPPMSAPVGPVPPGRAVGDAGTGLGIIRILPNSAPTKAIVPGMEDKLPKQAAAELGFGLASAQANSEAYLGFEHSVAQAAPGGIAIQGSSPQSPGALAQTASPDNAQPLHNGLSLPKSPLDMLITARGLQGQVHARWSDKHGPCVDPIADASTEVASLSLLNAIPTLPSTSDLTGVFDAPAMDARADQAIIDGLKQLTGPLSTLGGVLSGGARPAADGKGSLLSLPNTLSARSNVRLVDVPGSANKAVQSTSTMQVAAIKLLAGTPFELQLKVVSQPTLQVTSTGDEKTSTVRYMAPIIEVVQGGRSLGKLDAANPTLDVPIGLPLPGLPEKLPIIGDLMANGKRVTDAVQKIDLGVLRLGVAQLNQRGMAMTEPFQGFQLGATARMLDVQVLPTQALGLPNLPSALAQVSLGEQIARAYAPMGGVVCRALDQPAPPPPPKPQPRGLAYTTLAYQTVPMFWAGTAMLLVGVVLVAAIPTLRTARARGPVGPQLIDPPGRPEVPATDAEITETESTERAPATTDSEPEAPKDEPAPKAAEYEPQEIKGAVPESASADAESTELAPPATDTEPDTTEAEATKDEPAATEPKATEPEPQEIKAAAPESASADAEATKAESTEAKAAEPEPQQTKAAAPTSAPAEAAEVESAAGAEPELPATEAEAEGDRG